MRVTRSQLRRIIREAILAEVDIEDVSDICYAPGSTHVMKTCRIGGDKYFLKFSKEELFDGFDPSLQVLIEYLAYRIYGLYAGVRIPRVELVYDRSKQRVGLATTPAKGQQALAVGTSPKVIGRTMSQGVYVDVFLANWDVVGTGSGNVFVDPEEGATRIDPGGSLTFRAQGGRKGKAFSGTAGELETMLRGEKGAGYYFKHSDLQLAAAEFLRVDWPQIDATITRVGEEVSAELEQKGMSELLGEWRADVEEIRSILGTRYAKVSDHAEYALDQ